MNSENDLFPKILLCPKCSIRIPILPLFINNFNENGTIEILLNCECGNSVRIPLNDYLNLKAGKIEKSNKCYICSNNSPNEEYEYCINCNKYYCNECRNIFKENEKNHIFSKRQIYFNCICQQHINHKIEFFCYTCSKTLCIKCQKRHLKHNIKSLKNYYNELSERKIDKLKEEINNIFKYNENEKNNFLECISNNENYINVKKDFENIYETNKRLNEEILSFIELLYTNFIFGKDFLNYYLLCNFDYTTRLNKTEFKIKDKSNLKKYSKDIINYFKTNYIITFEYFYFYQNIDLIEEKEKISNIIGINKSIVIYATGCNLKAYNIITNKEISSISAHSKNINKMIKLKSSTENKIKIATGSDDNQIKLWNFNNFLQLDSSFSNDNPIINIIDFNNNNLYCISSENKIYIWDIEKAKKIKVIDCEYPIYSIIEFPKNNICYSQNNILLSLNDSKFQIILSDNPIINLFALDENNCVFISKSNILNVLDENFQKKKNINLQQESLEIGLLTKEILQIMFNDFSIRFYNVKTFEIIQFINVSLEKFYTLVVPINNYIASSSEKGLKIWIGQKLNPQEINYIIFC